MDLLLDEDRAGLDRESPTVLCHLLLPDQHGIVYVARGVALVEDVRRVAVVVTDEVVQFRRRDVDPPVAVAGCGGRRRMPRRTSSQLVSTASVLRPDWIVARTSAAVVSGSVTSTKTQRPKPPWLLTAGHHRVCAVDTFNCLSCRSRPETSMTMWSESSTSDHEVRLVLPGQPLRPVRDQEPEVVVAHVRLDLATRGHGLESERGLALPGARVRSDVTDVARCRREHRLGRVEVDHVGGQHRRVVADDGLDRDLALVAPPQRRAEQVHGLRELLAEEELPKKALSVSSTYSCSHSSTSASTSGTVSAADRHRGCAGARRGRRPPARMRS